MSVISKETWTPWKLIPKEVQDSLISDYKALLTSPNDKEREWAKGFEVIFGKDNLQPKPLTYEDVAEELFDGKDTFYISDIGSIVLAEGGRLIYNKYKLPNNCISQRQADKLLVINKLLNVATFLNKNEDGTPWKPDWSDENNEFYTLGIDSDGSVRVIKVNMQRVQTEIVYFRTEELAKQAIQILSEDTVRLALTTEY